MSQDNVELWVRRSIDAWSRGDREAWLSEVPSGWEFHTSGVFPGLKPVYRGPDGAVELWEAMRGPWERFAVAVERIEAVGDKVLALVTFRVHGRDGIETSRRWAYVVSFSDGTPTRTDNFQSWDDALEAVGLAE
jgi:ketosteroid isomerase-like protein